MGLAVSIVIGGLITIAVCVRGASLEPCASILPPLSLFPGHRPRRNRAQRPQTQYKHVGRMLCDQALRNKVLRELDEMQRLSSNTNHTMHGIANFLTLHYPARRQGPMLQAILSRVHYNLTHPSTPMAIMPLVEEQFREQQRKQTQAWKLIERLECPKCGKVYSAPYVAYCRNCGMELVRRVDWQ